MISGVRLRRSEFRISVSVSDKLSYAARQKRLGEIARAGIKESLDINRRALGREPPYTVYVDGRVNAPLESINPDRGRIVAEFHLLTDMIAEIDRMLIEHSPVLTGRYALSHLFTADGREASPANPPPAREYVFVNVQPYARKIERGQSSQALTGVYEVVAALASQRFGNIADIRFTYRTPLGGAIHDWAGKTQMESPGRRGEKRDEWLRSQPAIVIRVH